MDAGFEINGEFYPFPTAFRLGDPVLVAEVTGLEWMEFAEMLDEGSPRTLPGLVAVSVWQKNPGWRRDKVVRFVEAIDQDAVTVVQPEGTDAGPPDVADTTGTSPGGSTASSDSSVPSDAESLSSSGALV